MEGSPGWAKQGQTMNAQRTQGAEWGWPMSTAHSPSYGDNRASVYAKEQNYM